MKNDLESVRELAIFSHFQLEVCVVHPEPHPSPPAYINPVIRELMNELERYRELNLTDVLDVVYRSSHQLHEYKCTYHDGNPHMHHGVNCDEAHSCDCSWPGQRNSVIDALKAIVFRGDYVSSRV